MTEEIINLKDYFVHHYDDWGRLYCVEFKGSPLELENSIKRLEQDSKQLTQWLDEARRNADFWCDKCTSLEQENKELKKQIESDKGLITVGGKQQYEYLQRIDDLEQENRELKEENIEYDEELAIEKLSHKSDLETLERYRSALEK